MKEAEMNLQQANHQEYKLKIVGGQKLQGTVKISGAKNAVLKLMTATLLTPCRCIIHNVPKITDVTTMMELLNCLGAKAQWEDEATVLIDTSHEPNYITPDCYVRKMRASVQVMGPLLARLGKVRLFQPGGCIIGQRLIDLHLKGLQQLGAIVREEHGYVSLTASKLCGNEILLDFPSVGATENIMAAAILAQGTTIIRNAAREPEIIEEEKFYNMLGAKISGAGTDTIKIRGVERLNVQNAEYTVMPDRIESGTFMMAAAITGGELILQNIVPEHLESLSAKLREMGVIIEQGKKQLRVVAGNTLQAVDVTVLPYPGFPTDLQPQMAAVLSIAKGTGVISENVFDSRFRYVGELNRMGATIKVEGRSAIIKGVSGLSGAEVTAPDLRAGAALVLAGLAAEGTTLIEGTEHLERGYSSFAEKLKSIGADISRI